MTENKMAVMPVGKLIFEMSLPPLFSMFLQSIWIGADINVLIAGHLRKREQEEANKTVTLGLILSFLVGIILNITVLLIISPYFKSFTENNDISVIHQI